MEKILIYFPFSITYLYLTLSALLMTAIFAIPRLNLQQIVLEEIAWEDFIQLQSFWHKTIHWRPDTTYSHVYNPIRERDYERLFYSFREHPDAHRICVRAREGWIRLYSDTTTDAEWKEGARIASRDKFKRQYLEFQFLRNFTSYLDKAIIEFIEYKSEIIGYDLTVSRVLRNLFTLHQKKPEKSKKSGESEEQFSYYQGLWVPG